MIYFIRCAATGLTKVGYATNVRSRLSTLQTGSADDLSLVRLLGGAKDDEGKLHRRFAEHRKRGEWFDLADEIIRADLGLPDIALPTIKRRSSPSERQERKALLAQQQILREAARAEKAALLAQRPTLREAARAEKAALLAERPPRARRTTPLTVAQRSARMRDRHAAQRVAIRRTLEDAMTAPTLEEIHRLAAVARAMLGE